MLGELYKPKGMARETAQVVLEVEDPYACNIASGCKNRCAYCYVPKVTKTKEMRKPKLKPSTLVFRQLNNGLEPEGVFISFLTDPFLKENRQETEDLLEHLSDNNIRMATLSKIGISEKIRPLDLRDGMTIVSLDEGFWKSFEPNTTVPIKRVKLLEELSDLDTYTWVSVEPYPPSAIHKQDFDSLLEELNFVDLIVFGKWNYDKRANTEEARHEYRNYIGILTDFCKSNNIRLHVKSDTMNFAFLSYQK